MDIYVGNLSYQTLESKIQELFAQYGNVERVTILSDRETGNSRGFGFVTMANDDEANKAIAALNGFLVDGRNLRVNQAQDKPKTAGAGAGRPPREGSRREGGFRSDRGGDRGGRSSFSRR